MRTHVARLSLLAVALVAAAPARGQVWISPEEAPVPWAIAAPAAAPAPYAVAVPSVWAFPPINPSTPSGELDPGPMIVAPEAWLPSDPGDSLYRAARDALNKRRFGRADTLFAEIRARYPESGYVADSYYFQAFALQRLGGRDRGERALTLLTEQRSRFPSAATAGDAGQLRLRIQAALAEAGSARAAAAVDSAAQLRCADDDQELRATALSALVSMDADRALPILREILSSRDECSAALRRQALLLAARMGGDEVVSNMLDVALRDPDPEVRASAVAWLARSESAVAQTAVESILRETTDPKVQEQALAGLGRKGTPAAVAVLKSYLTRTDAPIELRAQAISWIGRDAKNGGLAYLREAYPSLNEVTLKEQVLNSVGRSTAEEDRAWLRARVLDANESAELRARALEWSARSNGFKVADLRQLYAAMEDPELRGQLIGMISRSDDPEAVDFMIDVATNEKDRELRQDVIRWLGRSKDPRAAEFLLKVIKGETK